MWLNDDLYALSSHAGDLVITEILYFGTSVPTEEFVEIYNAGGAAIDLTGFRLADFNVLVDATEDVDYTRPRWRARDHCRLCARRP